MVSFCCSCNNFPMTVTNGVEIHSLSQLHPGCDNQKINHQTDYHRVYNKPHLHETLLQPTKTKLWHGERERDRQTDTYTHTYTCTTILTSTHKYFSLSLSQFLLSLSLSKPQASKQRWKHMVVGVLVMRFYRQFPT
jgi:hypothetical protein